jgi:photosystem II protein
LRRASRKTVKPVASGGGKVDINKVGLNSIEDEVVKQNLMGRSRYMGKKDWVDSQGRKGKVGEEFSL